MNMIPPSPIAWECLGLPPSWGSSNSPARLRLWGNGDVRSSWRNTWPRSCQAPKGRALCVEKHTSFAARWASQVSTFSVLVTVVLPLLLWCSSHICVFFSRLQDESLTSSKSKWKMSSHLRTFAWEIYVGFWTQLVFPVASSIFCDVPSKLRYVVTLWKWQCQWNLLKVFAHLCRRTIPLKIRCSERPWESGFYNHRNKQQLWDCVRGRFSKVWKASKTGSYRVVWNGLLPNPLVNIGSS